MLLMVSPPLYSVAQKSAIDTKALYGSRERSPAIGVVTFTTSVDEKGVLGEIIITKEGKVSRKNIRSFKKHFREEVDRQLLRHPGPVNKITFTYRITAERKED